MYIYINVYYILFLSKRVFIIKFSLLGRSPGGGNGNPFQYSCLKNAMDRGAWQATVHGVTDSDMT